MRTYNQRYNDYLRSKKWKEKRDSALKRAGYRCQLCNSAKRLEVHHRTYENIFKEKDEDLTVLCNSCHTNHTKRLRRKHKKSKTQKLFDSEINIVNNQIKQLDNLLNKSHFATHRKIEEKIERLKNIRSELIFKKKETMNATRNITGA